MKSLAKPNIKRFQKVLISQKLFVYSFVSERLE